MIKVRETGDSLELPADEEILIGRYDVSNTVNLSLDLTPYGARENGVSRVHAAIRRGEDTLTLVDLNSANGTHLNGQRLTPNQPRVLRDGDEVRLGKLVFHVFFR
jgi:pSer/pThr/pTyr-binding forkhead associated (FHA) protein